MSALRLKKDLEKVLQSFCNSELRDMYQQMDEKQKEAMRNLIESIFRSVIGVEMNKEFFNTFQSYSKTPPIQTSKSLPSTRDPLIQSVLKGLGCTRFIDEKMLKNKLTTLGIKRPKEEQIFIHEFWAREKKEAFLKGNLISNSTTNSTIVKRDGLCCEVATLSPMQIGDLQLFKTAIGKYLEGKIITNPLIDIGIITLLEEDSGDYVQLGLYNLVTNSHEKWQLAEMKIPKGTRIRIIQPYYKIFIDGNPGIRVDSPEEVLFIDNTNSKSIEDIRAEGKQLIQSKDFIGALEIYLEGLKSFQEVFTLLNNRSQSHLNTGKYEEALLDAAAVLIGDQDNKKARHRYMKALEGLGHNKQNTNRGLWNSLLIADFSIPTQCVNKNFSKESGNVLFKEGKFSDAIIHYSNTLEAHKDACILLNNIAILCVKLQIYQTAIAAASGCLRITTDEEYRKKARFSMTKSFSIMGENDLAKLSAKDDSALKKLYDKNVGIKEAIHETLLNASSMDSLQEILRQKSDMKIVSEYVNADAVKHCYIKRKGRGIFAVRDISPDEVLIADHPVVSQNVDDYKTSATKNIILTHEIESNLLKGGDHLHMKEFLLRKIKHDGLLAKKLMLLDCRKGVIPNDSQRLPLLEDLEGMGYLSLSLEVPPFLTQTPREIGLDRGTLTASFINDVICINSFAWGFEEINKRVALALRISLLNHADHANCNYFPLGDKLVVFANRIIKRNEEITIKYNEKDHMRKWGL